MPFQVIQESTGVEIDDTTASTSKTYSSTKIVSELDKQLTEPLPKLSSNNNKYLKYVHGSSPIWDTPSTGSISLSYLQLTDTPSAFNNNSLLYSTTSGIAHTSTQIAIDGNGVEVNQLNARENNVSNIGDNSHKFNNVFCGNIHQGNVKLVIPSTRGSSGQYVKVNNATGETHTLEFFDILDDSAANNNTTYSSNKINTELATKSNTSHNHDDRYYTETESNTLLNGKIDKTSIQTLAEGNSTSETDVYSCNSVYSKNQIDTSVTSQEITVNNQTTTGRLNFGSNLTSGLYGTIQSFVNSTRYSSIHHYATSGNCNIDWYLMKNNAETKTITIRPNDSEKVFEVLTGGIKAPIIYQRDSTTIIKLGRMDSASLGIPGIAIIPLVNTVNSEIQMRGLRNTGILGDSYVQHQSGSTLTIQSRIATNRHSSTHANIEVSTYQNGAVTKVLDIGSNGSSKTITITGTTHGTGHFTTDQNNFTSNDQLVTKQYVDTSISNLVNSAPSTLDTLNELAAALGNDPNFATTVTNSIATKLPLSGGSMTGHITTNQTVFSNNNELVTKQYVDTQDATKLSLTGGSMTGHITTNQTVFSNNNELVTKQYVDTRLPTDVEIPVSYSIQNAVAGVNYVFGIENGNSMGLVEVPNVYTGIPASSRSNSVGYEAGNYGSGMVSLGYEALADGTGTAGQTNAVRSVAVGYQAGYHSQSANHGIYIGPYQGYQLSTSNQLRIGNSGVSPTTTGYDKAIIEGTMGTTDANQTLRLNADTIYLGSALPTSQPADNRLWLSNGNLSIGAVSGGGGGSTYLSLTDTPSTHSANSLLYSTGTAIAHTTSQILIDGNGVEVNQLNARVNDTSNIGDSSHRFNTVNCLAVQSTGGKLIIPTSSGSVGQFLSIASLNGSDMTLGFSTASGPTYNTLDMTSTDPNGHGRGLRRDIIVENCCFSNNHNELAMLFNGRRGAGGTNGEGNYHYYLREGGALIFWHTTYSYNWNTFYMDVAWNSSTADCTFKIFGSNDKISWTELASNSWNNWATWSASASDSGIEYQQGGNVRRKLQWTQASNVYYRFYMFKCHQKGSIPATTPKTHGFNAWEMSIYEMEWGRE